MVSPPLFGLVHSILSENSVWGRGGGGAVETACYEGEAIPSGKLTGHSGLQITPQPPEHRGH